MNVRRLLLPFSAIYQGVTTVRNILFDTGIVKQKKFQLPVICVGNLSTGGTGKSPLVAHLLNILHKENKTAVLSRGYGRKTKGFLEVGINSTTGECGDEPLEYKSLYPETGIFVCEDRAEGIEKIIRIYNPDVILLDDAYQHRYVKPSLNILLTTYSDPFYNDAVLPSGNLRESRSGKKRADVIIITKCPADLSTDQQKGMTSRLNLEQHQTVFYTGMHYGELQPVYNSPHLLSDAWDKLNVLLVTGIADASGITDFCKKRFASVESMRFKDHHPYSASDYKAIERKFNNIASPSLVITTSKDYMRIKGNLQEVPLYILPVQPLFLHNTAGEFENYIKEHVGKNK